MRLISSGSVGKAFIVQVIIGFFLALFSGPIDAWPVENFNAKIRLASASFGKYSLP